MKVPFSEHLLWNGWKIGKAVIKETTYLRDLSVCEKDLFPALNAPCLFNLLAKYNKSYFSLVFFKKICKIYATLPA